MTIDLPLALDLLGVFFFAVSGSLLAARKGFDLVGSVLLGSMVGLGGGIMRDIIANQVPKVFDPQDRYAIPVLSGAALATGLWHLGWLNLATGTVAAVAGFAMRMLSLRYGWRPPLAARSWAPRLPRRR